MTYIIHIKILCFLVFSAAGILHEHCNTRLMVGNHTSSFAAVKHTSIDCIPIWMECAAVGKGRCCCAPHANYSKLATSASSFVAGLCTHCLSLKSFDVVKLGEENFFSLNDNLTNSKITTRRKALQRLSAYSKLLALNTYIYRYFFPATLYF